MAFVEQEDVLQTFQKLITHLFIEVLKIEITEFPKMTYADAMRYYGNDKPDTRFEM
jgi:aspartyl-tRNA synthetase